MRKVILALVVAASTITGAATAASAQGVYFGFGDGGYRHNYYGDSYRPYYRPRAYAYGERCSVRTVRKFDRYRGVWVVRRIRTCD